MLARFRSLIQNSPPYVLDHFLPIKIEELESAGDTKITANDFITACFVPSMKFLLQKTLTLDTAKHERLTVDDGVSLITRSTLKSRIRQLTNGACYLSFEKFIAMPGTLGAQSRAEEPLLYLNHSLFNLKVNRLFLNSNSVTFTFQ